jgi:hypothetical protein
MVAYHKGRAEVYLALAAAHNDRWLVQLCLLLAAVHLRLAAAAARARSAS